MVLVGLLAVIGVCTILVLAVVGAAQILDILDAEARARRIRDDAAATQAQLQASAWAARRAMQEEARRRPPGSGPR